MIYYNPTLEQLDKILTNLYASNDPRVKLTYSDSETFVAAITELVDKDYTFYYNRVLLEIEVFK